MSSIDSEIEIIATIAGTLFLLIGYFAYRWRRYRSFDGVLFGAKVERAAGEVTCVHKGATGSATLKLQVLSRESGEKLIGLKYVVTHPLGFEMTPVVLSANQAQKLSQLLREAVGVEGSHNKPSHPTLGSGASPRSSGG